MAPDPEQYQAVQSAASFDSDADSQEEQPDNDN